MKQLYLMLFVLFTLTEILFTAIYWMLYGHINAVMIAGLLLYLAGMVFCYCAYRVASYQDEKKQLLDQLP